MIKMILFDLDGTLLPMDQEIFIKAYFSGIANKFVNYGYEPNMLIASIWEGTKAMIKNDGSKTNEEVFWDCFAYMFGEKVKVDEPKVHVIDSKTLGFLKAFNKLIAKLDNCDTDYPIVPSYTYECTNLDKLIERTNEKYQKVMIEKDDLDLAIAAHWGSKAFGYIYVAKN